MTDVLIKRQRIQRYLEHHHVITEAKSRGVYLSTEKPEIAANHQKLGEKRGTNSTSETPEEPSLLTS